MVQINIKVILWFFPRNMRQMIPDCVRMCKNITQALHFDNRKVKVKVDTSKLYQNCNGQVVPKNVK